MANLDDYYRILELEPNASAENIKKAYRDLVQVWHPDRFAHDPRLQRKAEEKLMEIKKAYEQLQSIFSNTSSRESQSSNASGSKPGSGASKSDEATPEPPPRSPTQTATQDFAFSLRELDGVVTRWVAAVIVLLIWSVAINRYLSLFDRRS